MSLKVKQLFDSSSSSCNILLILNINKIELYYSDITSLDQSPSFILSWLESSDVIAVDLKSVSSNIISVLVLCADGDLVVTIVDIRRKVKLSNKIFSYENSIFGSGLCFLYSETVEQMIACVFIAEDKYILTISLDILQSHDINNIITSTNLNKIQFRVPINTPILNYQMRDLDIHEVINVSNYNYSILGKFKSKFIHIYFYFKRYVFIIIINKIANVGNLVLQWMEIQNIDEIDKAVIYLVLELCFTSDIVYVLPDPENEQIALVDDGNIMFFNRAGEDKSAKLNFLGANEAVTSIMYANKFSSQPEVKKVKSKPKKGGKGGKGGMTISSSTESLRKDLNYNVELFDLEENSREGNISINDSDSESDDQEDLIFKQKYFDPNNFIVLVSTSLARYFRVELIHNAVNQISSINFDQMLPRSLDPGGSECYLPVNTDMTLVAGRANKNGIELNILASNESFGVQCLKICQTDSFETQNLKNVYRDNVFDRLVDVNRVNFING